MDMFMLTRWPKWTPLNGEVNMLTIPAEYQKLSQNKAAKMAGIPRSTFRRKYWDNGILSIHKDHEGNDYVTFDELHRVFGETVIHAVKQEIDGHAQTDGEPVQKLSIGTNGHVHADQMAKMDTHSDKMDIEILLENERLKAEKAGMQNLVQELRNQLEREKDRLNTAEQKNNQLETQYRALLEDKSHYTDQNKQIQLLQEQQQKLIAEVEHKSADSKQKPWFLRLFRS
jgi:hypothetical protein